MTYSEEVVIDNIICVTLLPCGIIPCVITGNGMYGFLGIILYIILVCVSIYLFERNKIEAEKKSTSSIQYMPKIINLSLFVEGLKFSYKRKNSMSVNEMNKHDLYCTHCGKLILHGTDALDFEGFIYCSKHCIDDEIREFNSLSHNLNDYEINQIIEEDGGIRPFNWDILNC